jgi:hypothetical protein
MKWGTKYPSCYVNNIYAKLKRTLSCSNIIYCFTDDGSGIDPEIPIIKIPEFSHNFNRRILLFKKGFSNGMCCVIDLDINIIHDFSHFINTKTDGITVINSHWKNTSEYKNIHSANHGYRTTINGSITSWYADDPYVCEIYDHFMSDPIYYTAKYHDDHLTWGSIDQFVEWEHLRYNTFLDEIAFSHSLGPHDDDVNYCVELYHRGSYEELYATN